MTARKPAHLKLLANTARADRVAPSTPALPLLVGTPTAPAWLSNIFAVAEFRRLAAVLVKNKLLTEGNTHLVASLSMLNARLAETWTSGGTPTAALMTVQRRLSNDLGLTSMTVPAPAGKPNRFHLLNGKRR